MLEADSARVAALEQRIRWQFQGPLLFAARTLKTGTNHPRQPSVEVLADVRSQLFPSVTVKSDSQHKSTRQVREQSSFHPREAFESFGAFYHPFQAAMPPKASKAKRQDQLYTPATSRLASPLVRATWLLRFYAVCKLEGDVGEQLSEHFGTNCQRASEGVSSNGGLLHLRRSEDVGQIVTGVKTTPSELNLVLERGRGNVPSLVYRGQVNITQKQRESRATLITWPRLRADSFLTLLRPDKVDLEETDQAELRYKINARSTLLNPIIPPTLWPLTRTKDEVFSILEDIRPTTPVDDTSDPPDTAAEPEDPTAKLIHGLVHFLSDKCEGSGSKVTSFEAPKYQPYTADVRVTMRSGNIFFGEIKHGQCRIVKTDNDYWTILHHPLSVRRGGHRFTFASGPWSFLLTEVSGPERRFPYKDYQIPEEMLLIPWNMIGKEWWNTKSTEKVRVRVSKGFFIRPRRKVVSQFSKIFESLSEARLALPSLGSLGDISPQELAIVAGYDHHSVLVSEDNDTRLLYTENENPTGDDLLLEEGEVDLERVEKDAYSESDTDVGTAHGKGNTVAAPNGPPKLGRSHQARASVHFLRECRSRYVYRVGRRAHANPHVCQGARSVVRLHARARAAQICLYSVLMDPRGQRLRRETSDHRTGPHG